jgi:hypothetical protein
MLGYQCESIEIVDLKPLSSSITPSKQILEDERTKVLWPKHLARELALNPLSTTHQLNDLSLWNPCEPVCSSGRWKNNAYLMALLLTYTKQSISRALIKYRESPHPRILSNLKPCPMFHHTLSKLIAFSPDSSRSCLHFYLSLSLSFFASQR